MSSIKPIYIDGACLIALASFITLFSYLTSQPDSVKYLGAGGLFWCKGVSAALATATGTLTTFRAGSNSATALTTPAAAPTKV